MRICTECREHVLEVVDDWLVKDFEGGMIGTSGHWDEYERRECPPFVFHWGIEEVGEPDWDDEDAE